MTRRVRMIGCGVRHRVKKEYDIRQLEVLSQMAQEKCDVLCFCTVHKISAEGDLKQSLSPTKTSVRVMKRQILSSRPGKIKHPEKNVPL